MPDTDLFSVQHLVKRYGDATVVNDLSFSIGPGECLGVIGPNGAGKTTTIRMCLGLCAPDSSPGLALALLVSDANSSSSGMRARICASFMPK